MFPPDLDWNLDWIERARRSVQSSTYDRETTEVIQEAVFVFGHFGFTGCEGLFESFAQYESAKRMTLDELHRAYSRCGAHVQVEGFDRIFSRDGRLQLGQLKLPAVRRLFMKSAQDPRRLAQLEWDHFYCDPARRSFDACFRKYAESRLPPLPRPGGLSPAAG